MGRIKALLLRRINNYFGDAFGDASAAFRQAAAAGSCGRRNRRAAVEEEWLFPLLLRLLYKRARARARARAIAIALLLRAAV